MGVVERARKETRAQAVILLLYPKKCNIQTFSLRVLIKMYLFRVAALTKLPRAVVEESEELQVRICDQTQD